MNDYYQIILDLKRRIETLERFGGGGGGGANIPDGVENNIVSIDDNEGIKDSGVALTDIGDMKKSVYDASDINQQLVGTTATQTITNKDLTSATNTLNSVYRKFASGTIVVNPGGSNSVTITHNTGFGHAGGNIAVNGDSNAWAGFVIACNNLSSNQFTARLNENRSGHIRLNWFVFSP